jgi:urease accessory protein
VSVAAGAAGPVGGDQLTLDIDVGPGSALVLTDISPTLLLPGPHGRPSRSTTRVKVKDGATLVWLPEPLIAAANCNHFNDIRVELASTARLLIREELILGRCGEEPGSIQQRLQVRRGGQPLYHQNLHVGPDAPGWNSAAVTATHRAVGSLLVVNPGQAWPINGLLLTDTAALLPLSGPAVLITALADDSLDLRKALIAGLSELGRPWQTDSPAERIGTDPSTEAHYVPTEEERRGA